jgi:hypothetical protein
MEQFDYNKYRKNNLLLKEDTPPKLGTPPPSQVSKVGAKTSKFVADNKTFIEKMKAVVGSDIKVLASIMKTIMNTVVTDKKIPLSSDAKKVIDFLNSVAAQNTSQSNVKENVNEAERMQQLAELITESQLNELGLASYYNNADRSTKAIAKKLDNILAFIAMDKKQHQEITELITDLVDAYAQERIDNLDSERN